MSLDPDVEAGRRTSEAFQKGFQQRSDTTAIDQILNQASDTGNPADIQNAMNQILARVSPERQGPALALLQQRQQQLQQQKQLQRQQKAFADLGLNESLANLPPAVQTAFVKSSLTEKKPPLTPNEEFNQIRANAKQAANVLTAPYRNVFGGLELADKKKRQEINEQLKSIQDIQNKQIAAAAKRHGVKAFDMPVDEDDELQGFINDLEEKKELTSKIVTKFLSQAAKEGLSSKEQSNRAREIAKQQGYQF